MVHGSHVVLFEQGDQLCDAELQSIELLDDGLIQVIAEHAAPVVSEAERRGRPQDVVGIRSVGVRDGASHRGHPQALPAGRVNIRR